MTPAEALHLYPIIKAYAEGATIQYLTTNGWQDFGKLDTPSFNRMPLNHRIKPEVKYRPWKLDEVPLGKIVRHKANNGRALLTAVYAEAQELSIVVPSQGSYAPVTLLSCFTMEDGTPCGIPE